MVSSNKNYSSNFYKSFTNVVIGISDGLIVPFAVTTGLSVLLSTNLDIWQSGLVVVLAGAIIMSLGGYFAAKDRLESFANRSEEEEERLKQEELSKTLKLFKELDLGKDMEDQAAEVIENDTHEWKAYREAHMSEQETQPSSKLPKTAFIIGLSYAIGGLIPLIPYACGAEKETAFAWSASISLLALLIFGFIKSKVNREPLLWGTFRLMLLGAAAAAVVFVVARVFAP